MLNEDIDFTKLNLDWCIDCLNKIQEVLKSVAEPESKISSIEWLVKQALIGTEKPD